MSGALLQIMADDLRANINSGGFERPLTFVSRDDLTTVIINGMATLHNTQLDPDTGTFVNMRTAHVLVTTQDLVEAGFPIYAGSKKSEEPYLKDVKISFVDIQGVTRNFIAEDIRPSDLGTLTIMLRDV